MIMTEILPMPGQGDGRTPNISKKYTFLCKNHEKKALKQIQMIAIQYQQKIVAWRVQTNAIVFFAQMKISPLRTHSASTPHPLRNHSAPTPHPLRTTGHTKTKRQANNEQSKQIETNKTRENKG